MSWNIGMPTSPLTWRAGFWKKLRVVCHLARMDLRNSWWTGQRLVITFNCECGAEVGILADTDDVVHPKGGWLCCRSCGTRRRFRRLMYVWVRDLGPYAFQRCYDCGLVYPATGRKCPCCGFNRIMEQHIPAMRQLIRLGGKRASN
jgi:hypothetical protein